MIRVGEGTGKLEEAFMSLYHQLEFDREMKQRIKSAMRYPIFVMVALGIALAVVTFFVIPAFAKTYASLKVALPLVTRMLLAVSAFAVNYWWAGLFILGITVWLARMLLRMPHIRYAWDRFKLRIPVLGPIITKATVARFARSFSTAIKSDVPLVTAFSLVARVLDNKFYEERVLQMRTGVERGEILSRVMRSSGIFSPLELQLITVAEATGDVENAVGQLATLYTEDLEYEVSRMSQTIEPLLLAVMGVLVGLLVLGVFLPMWDLGSAYFHKG
jgi:MSHA biogenesis protein MshG